MSTNRCPKCACVDIRRSSVPYTDRQKFTCAGCGFWWTAPTPENMAKQIQSWRNQEEGK